MTRSDNPYEAHDRAARYGVQETNPIANLGEDYHSTVDHSVTYRLSDPEVVKIVRLRLIGYNRFEYPRWDVSYCHGRLADGTLVPVDLGDHQLPPRYKARLLELAKEAGRYAKGMGLLDDGVISTLHG
jgi:hypothetical protein